MSFWSVLTMLNLLGENKYHEERQRSVIKASRGEVGLEVKRRQNEV